MSCHNCKSKMFGNVIDEPVLTSPKRHFAAVDDDRLFSTSSFRYVQTIMAIYSSLKLLKV